MFCILFNAYLISGLLLSTYTLCQNMGLLLEIASHLENGIHVFRLFSTS